MGGIHAQYAHLAREEVQFFQRPRQCGIVGMPIDIGKELRRERRYVTVRARGTNQHGTTCFEGVLTLIWAA